MKPDKPIVRWYLEDADYPVKQQVVPVAEGNGAPVAFVERLRNPGEVAEPLERQDQSYEEQARSRRGSF